MWNFRDIHKYIILSILARFGNGLTVNLHIFGENEGVPEIEKEVKRSRAIFQ